MLSRLSPFHWPGYLEPVRLLQTSLLRQRAICSPKLSHPIAVIAFLALNFTRSTHAILQLRKHVAYKMFEWRLGVFFIKRPICRSVIKRELEEATNCYSSICSNDILTQRGKACQWKAKLYLQISFALWVKNLKCKESGGFFTFSVSRQRMKWARIDFLY